MRNESFSFGLEWLTLKTRASGIKGLCVCLSVCFHWNARSPLKWSEELATGRRANPNDLKRMVKKKCLGKLTGLLHATVRCVCLYSWTHNPHVSHDDRLCNYSHVTQRFKSPYWVCDLPAGVKCLSFHQNTFSLSFLADFTTCAGEVSFSLMWIFWGDGNTLGRLLVWIPLFCGIRSQFLTCVSTVLTFLVGKVLALTQ